MPSPFPGMDPFLEQSLFWSSFHSRLIVAIADVIEPQLGDRYYIEVETRTYQADDATDESVLVGIPDAAIFSRSPTESEQLPLESETGIALQARPMQVQVPLPQTVTERYLEVRELGTDAVVTVIEVLSPKNKRSGEGRTGYEQKRRRILGSNTHLIELDLLRAGKPMPMHQVPVPTAYRLLISRATDRPTADLYGLTLQAPLPALPLPLLSAEIEPMIPLQAVFEGVYERARYRSRIDYTQPIPPPALSNVEQAWVETLLAPMRGAK